MKPVILTATWKRPEVFRIFCESVKPLDVDVVVVGSPHDDCRDLANRYGLYYTTYQNQPLHLKWNHGAKYCKQLNPSCVIMMGSDDILTKPLLDRYISEVNEGTDYTYLLDCYFYDLESKQSIYWKGYRMEANRGHALGAGRCMSRNLMTQLGWQPWASGFDAVLDTGMDTRLKECKYKSKALRLKDEGLFLLDIKSRENMTPFALWDNSEYIDSRVIMSHLPYNITELL